MALDRAVLIYVPFNAAGVRTGVARGPAVIEAAGRAIGVHTTRPQEHLVTVSGLSPERGPAGLAAETALTAMLTDTSATVAKCWAQGQLPIVVGGDCSVLLAPLMAAAGRAPRENQAAGAALLFVDGHEDAWPPRLSPTGETADCELGLALGHHRPPAALADRLPCLSAEHTVVVGPRDLAELEAAGVPSLRGRVAAFLDATELAAAAPAAVPDALAAAAADRGWWLHVDLDVLSGAALGAVDYPQPGGLSWAELEDLVARCAGVPNCLGASVVIYNPDLDRGAAGPRVAEFVTFLRARLTGPAAGS